MLFFDIKKNKIIGLKSTNSFQGGFCEKSDLVILSNLYEETTNTIKDCNFWGKLFYMQMSETDFGEFYLGKTSS